MLSSIYGFRPSQHAHASFELVSSSVSRCARARGRRRRLRRGRRRQRPADVPADAIAVVGDREIPKSEYDRLLTPGAGDLRGARAGLPAGGDARVRAASSNALVQSLVEQAQFEIAAEELDVTVTDEELDKRLDELKQQFFDGDEQKYQDELEKQGLTEEQVLKDLRTRMISEKIFEKVTSDVKVSDADIQEYYDENKAQFEQPAERARSGTSSSRPKAKADAASTRSSRTAPTSPSSPSSTRPDTGSKASGGKFTASEGRDRRAVRQGRLRAEDRRALRSR